MIHRYNDVMPDTSAKLYTAEQVRGLDYAAIHDFGIAGYELMQRAGRAVVEDVRVRFPGAQSWLILCGPGNNGGDGYVVARLAAEAGVNVVTCSVADTDKLTGDAAIALADWRAAGGEVCGWPLAVTTNFDLALDALLGTGIDREVGGNYRDAIGFLNQLDCPKFAIDIPSGLNADTGCVMGCAVQAGGTMTFVGRKRGMYTADGPDHCGDIAFDDLAIPPAAGATVRDTSAGCGGLLSLDTLAGILQPRFRNSHKGSYGHVLAVGGDEGMSGAIRLCGEAALRSGAGRVTMATHRVHAGFINLARPELMVRAVDGGSELPSLLDKGQVVAVGPGLGRTAWSESLLHFCLGVEAPLVVDADGLNLLAQQSRESTVSRDQWILTPHPAEAARLLGWRVSRIQQDRVLAAQTVADRFGACVVLKGCGTVIAAPGGEYAICPLGNPGMATAGSGDVLTGIIVALLGQDLSCFSAAIAGVVAHAEAGDRAARQMGEMALMAGDITDQLASVWKSIER